MADAGDENSEDQSLEDGEHDNADELETYDNSAAIFASDGNTPRQFVCKHPGCGKFFTKSSNLTQHNRIHSGYYYFLIFLKINPVIFYLISYYSLARR